MDREVTSDPIIDEIHATRRAMSEKFGGDLMAMLEDAKRRQEASGRPIWKPKVAATLPIDIGLSATSPERGAESSK